MTDKLLAQIINPVLPTLGGTSSYNDPEVGTKLTSSIVKSMASAVFILSFVLLFIYLITSGIAWLTSEGDKGKLESARNKLTNAVIGMVIVAAAWAIFNLVGQFIGIDVNGIPFPTMGR